MPNFSAPFMFTEAHYIDRLSLKKCFFSNWGPKNEFIESHVLAFFMRSNVQALTLRQFTKRQRNNTRPRFHCQVVSVLVLASAC